MIAASRADVDVSGRGDVDPDLALARSIARVTAEMADVERLSSGPAGVHATWRRGQRCPGVRIDRAVPPHVEVRVVASRPDVVAGLGARLRRRLREHFGDRLGVVDVHVADVRVDADGPDASPAVATGAPSEG